MFTGLVQNKGILKKRSGDTFSFEILSPIAAKIGDSISVNGVCLTVTGWEGASFSADLSAETLRLTTAANWQTGQELNIEPALTASMPLGGHIVQGHIDATGEVKFIRPEGSAYEITIEFPESLHDSIVSKGSICVDGVSLTVNELPTPSSFKVMIIPHTWETTTIRAYQVGQRVNLEVDILAKYVQRAMQSFKEISVNL